MEQDSKPTEQENETPQETSSAAEPSSQQDTSDRKDDDEEEEEEEEEDRIVEKSHNSRFHKRNKRFPKQMEGVDNAFIAIEPKSGKEVIWNECILSEKKTDKENRYLSIIKKLKKSSHPFLARFLDAWVSKSEDGSRKLVFITERLDECSLKQFLCNSAKNNRLWKRHVGQILSVLMFLHRLGITHGNLSKESIYYQNSGNLRVGPFALGGCLDQKSQSADLYSLGVVALEIAIWTPTEFPQSLPLADRCQQMLAKLENCAQRDFIEACLDPNPNTRNKMKRLINHPAVTEVPILKLLSAKVIVETMKSVTNEDAPAAEQTGFATLLKDYLSHYEDETVIVEVHFLHDKVVNSRSWKDFRSNFTLTSKFLEDVKNGFYPLFGCRWNWAAEQEDDEESLTGAITGANSTSGGNASGIGVSRAESTAIPSIAHSSGTSAAPSACVSRKHSTVTKTVDPTQGTHVALESDKEAVESKVVTNLPGGRSTSLSEYPSSRQSSVLSRVRPSDATAAQFATASTGLGGRKPSKDCSLRLTGSIGTPGSKTSDVVGTNMPKDQARSHSPSPAAAKSSLPTQAETTAATGELSKLGIGQANAASLRRSVSPAPCAPTADGSEKNTHTGVVDGDLHEMSASSGAKPVVVGETSLAAGKLDIRTTGLVRETGSLPDLNRLSPIQDLQSDVAAKRITVTGTPADQNAAKTTRSGTGQEPEEEGLEEDKEEEEEEEEEDDDDDDEEDEEEDDDEKKVVDTLERFEPQTVHVVAPERAPNHPALFTHCQYFYIGAGRWQVYVQMWFVEDRLKREAYVQVFDYEWHDYERVADLFEASRCLNPVDRPSLVRLLSLARHNCALIDGDLQLPGPLISRPSNFDVFELHEKLTALRLHQQAREQLQREAGTQDGGQAPDSTHDPSVSTSGLDTGQPSSVPAEKDSVPMVTGHDGFDNDTRPAAPEDVPACADHVAQLQEHQRIQNQSGRAVSPPRATTNPPAPADSEVIKESAPGTGRTRADVSGSTNALFLDVGALAPRNAYCAFCDTHEYLHRVDLPAYLISPCYHCREWLAREAKLSPEVLLDLHLRHSIPWPAFLQARFNLPPDGRSIEELISYDCRWRCRQPCRCLVSSGGPLLPPCVEFPWLCPPASTTSWDVGTGSSGTPGLQLSHPPATTNASLPVSESNPADPMSVPAHPETAPNPNETAISSTPGDSRLPSHAETKTVSTSQGSAANHLPTESAGAPAAAASSTGSSRPTLPCAHRHPRGAPTKCCHGIQFPLIGVAGSTSGSSHYNQNQLAHHIPPNSQPESCSTTSATTGHGAAPPSSAGGSQPAPLVTNGVV